MVDTFVLHLIVDVVAVQLHVGYIHLDILKISQLIFKVLGRAITCCCYHSPSLEMLSKEFFACG